METRKRTGKTSHSDGPLYCERSNTDEARSEMTKKGRRKKESKSRETKSRETEKDREM